MITIQIGQELRTLEEATESWINQQINRRKADGIAICVKVTIKEEQVNMTLTTPSCPQSAGGGRAPNRKEQRIFDLWEQRHLNNDKFTGGNLIAFLRQLDR